MLQVFVIAAKSYGITKFTVTCRRFAIKWISSRSVPRRKSRCGSRRLTTCGEGTCLFLVPFKYSLWSLLSVTLRQPGSPGASLAFVSNMLHEKGQGSPCKKRVSSPLTTFMLLLRDIELLMNNAGDSLSNCWQPGTQQFCRTQIRCTDDLNIVSRTYMWRSRFDKSKKPRAVYPNIPVKA